MRNRRTVERPAELVGRGAHTGASATLRLNPAEAGSGITFCRTDLPGRPIIPADLSCLVEDQMLRRTTLARGGASVCTVEHLLSALYALGIDDAFVELSGPECPFLDGSAAPFAQLVQSAGIVESGVPLQIATVKEPIVFSDDDVRIVALPSDGFRVTYFFASDNPLIRRQSASLPVTPESYAETIAPARTFCFFEEIESLRKAGLIQGASLASAVVIGRKSVINDKLRFSDEPVRHKILDFTGDLALLGRPVLGHFLAWRSGHRTNALFGLFLRRELGIE